MIGKTVSHYRITAKLGQGGMGEVYRAEDTKLKRSVVLKRMAPHLRTDTQYCQLFQKSVSGSQSLSDSCLSISDCDSDPDSDTESDDLSLYFRGR